MFCKKMFTNEGDFNEAVDQEWCLNGLKRSSDPFSLGAKYLFPFFFFVLLPSILLDFSFDC